MKKKNHLQTFFKSHPKQVNTIINQPFYVLANNLSCGSIIHSFLQILLVISLSSTKTPLMMKTISNFRANKFVVIDKFWMNAVLTRPTLVCFLNFPSAVWSPLDFPHILSCSLPRFHVISFFQNHDSPSWYKKKIIKDSSIILLAVAECFYFLFELICKRHIVDCKSMFPRSTDP